MPLKHSSNKNGKRSLLWRQVPIVAITFIAVMVAILLNRQAYRETREMAKEQFNHQQLILARSAAAGIETFITAVDDDLLALSNFPAVQRMEPGILERMEVLYMGIPPQTSSRRLDKNGILRFVYPNEGWRKDLIGRDYSEDAFFQETKETGEIVVSGLVINEAGDRRIQVLRPVYVENDKGARTFNGVVIGSFDPDTMASLYISPIVSGETGYAWLLNEEGILLAHHEEEFVGRDAFKVRAETNPELPYDAINNIQRQMMTGEEGVSRYVSGWHRGQRGAIEKLVAYTPVHVSDHVWSVAVCAPVDEVERITSEARRGELYTLGFIVLTLTAAGVSFFVAFYRWTRSLQQEIEIRKQAEGHIVHLNAVLRAIRGVNQLITRVKDREKLLQGACDNLIETRGYHSAWIALMEEESRFVTAAQAGVGKDFPAAIDRLKRGDLTWCIRQAVKQSGVVVVADPAVECGDCPLVGTYAGKARTIVRLEYEGRVYGFLTVTVPVEMAADDEERSLFGEVAGDIAFALHTIEVEADRQRAEEALWVKDSAIASSINGIALADLEGNLTYVNPYFLELWGYDEDKEVLGKSVVEFCQPEEEAAEIIEALRGGESRISELVAKRKDGSLFDVQFSVSMVTDGAGKPVCMMGSFVDITERKRAEEALRESEERLRNLMETVPVGISISTSEKGVIEINPAVLEIFGYNSKEEFLKIPASAHYYESKERERFLELHEKGVVKDFEARFKRKDGAVIWLSVASTSQTDEDGKTLFMNTFQDITERKRAEKTLRKSEQRYRSLFEGLPVGLYRMTPQGLILHANPALVQMLGYPDRRTLMAVNALDLYVNPEDDKRQQALLEREGIVRDFEMQLRRYDGTDIWVRNTVQAVRSDRRDVFYHEGSMEDITERKRAEEERDRLLAQIQEQAQQVQQIMDTVPEGVLLLDADGQVALANPLGRKDLAALANASVGDTLTHLGDRPLAELLTSPPKGLWHEVATDGRSFEVIARPLETGPTPGGWVLVMRDVTQEREIQRRAQQQERLATVGQLAAGIAHDFNNIMATIVLYAQMLSQTEDLTPRGHERLATVNQQAMHATNLTQQILDFSRRAVLERRPLNLLPLLKEQIKLLERTLPENIKIALAYGPDEYTVNADPTRVQQAVMNLALNARDAMPEGGDLRIGLERIQVQPGESPPLPEMEAGEWVQVTVADTGTGIPPDVLPHVFDPFFTTKAPGEGSGLGLAQVHGIVKQHEGEIDVQSQVGHGTTFTIYLPALPVHQPEAPTLELLTLTKGQGETILVVEDNQATRQALVDSLELLNYRTLEAADGQEALEILERQTAEISSPEVSLVLSDVVMPEMGGIALFHALRQRGLMVKVVLMTGHPLEEEMESLRTQGLSDWLPKPSNLEQLAQVLTRVLEEG